jgi:hypothetical protein
MPKVRQDTFYRWLYVDVVDSAAFREKLATDLEHANATIQSLRSITEHQAKTEADLEQALSTISKLEEENKTKASDVQGTHCPAASKIKR